MDIFSEALLEMEGIEEYRKEYWDYYDYNNTGVPRVTHIIKSCRNNDKIVQWAANIGSYKYKYYSEKACSVGTNTHEKIESFLKHELLNKHSYPAVLSDPDEYPYEYKVQSDIAFKNFKLWYSNMKKIGFPINKLIGIEVPISCPWFGGTIDAIVEINKAVYIIDFKTSKAITPEYLIQTSAYMWVVNNGYATNLPHVDGVGIIRVDKGKLGVFEDVFLNEFIADQSYQIHQYQSCFASYVDAYYKTIATNSIYKNYKELYNIDSVMVKAPKKKKENDNG